MRALIVGCGYVGLPLGAKLAKLGHEVFGLRRSSDADRELRAAGINPLHADITQPRTLDALPTGFDWVVNCAATGGGGVEDYRQLYLEGTRNLITCLVPGSADILPAEDGGANRRTCRRDADAPRFVYTSSTGVYGQNDGSVVDETSPATPAVETGKILVETERLLLGAARARNFPAIILRVAGIYGPDRGYLLKQYLKGEARIEGNGGRILNMIHRDDLISAIIAALERGRPGEIYNAVDDEPVSQLKFFEWLAKTLGKELSPTMSENMEANRKRGLTSKQVSNHKLKMELCSQFKYPTFREGYTAEIERLRAAGKLELR